MGKRDTDGESYNLSDLPGKIPGSVVDDDADIDSQPSSTSSSGKMPKKVQIGGAESFEDVDLRHGATKDSSHSSSSASSPNLVTSSNGSSRNMFTSKIGKEDDFQLNLNQSTNGVYKSKPFDDDVINHRTFVDPPTNDKTTEEPEKSDLEKLKPVPFHRLFRFSSCQDRVLIAVAIIAAVFGGCTLPVMIVLFGDLTNAFVTNGIDLSLICDFLPQCCTDGFIDFNATDCNVTPEMITSFMPSLDFFEEITKFGTGTGCIGFINFIMGYIFVTCLNHAAECQVYRIRGLFLQSVLRQDIGWYDTHQTGDFASKMTEDLNKLQEGIGEKIGMFIFFMTIFLASIINAFIHGWELTLVILAAMPVLSISLGIIARSQTTLTEKELAAYGKAGAIAEEVLSSIRTVIAFGGQQKEVKRYEGRLVHARRAGIMRGLLTGVGGGLMWFIIYSSYALAFWYGVKLIMDDRESCLADLKTCHIRYDPSSLLIVFFSVLMGAMNVGQASPYVEAFSTAKAAAAAIFAVIDRKPPIDSLSDEGDIPHEDEKDDEGSRDIIFEDVYFNYPARADVNVLTGLNLRIRKGETVALVGSSGCGKSTCIQLIQRFYDPESGSIRLGKRNIADLNIGWLRERIGVVGQEPVLFGCTIYENIQFGREGVTEEEIEKACKEANAYDFIQKLPKKYNTLVGERGAQLSGGQKQRIAIARALVRNPEILLLDEATSALDTQSESVVQAALDKARSGRTTIVVAHRLSTIRSADTIVALKDGQVAEMGSHGELMKARGLYHSLVTAQISQEKKDDAIDEEEDDVDYDDLETVDQTLPSLVSLASSHGGGFDSLTNGIRPSFRRKSLVDRKISVSSIMSDDSMDFMEEAGRAVGSAVGFARMNSTPLRESRRRKRSLVQQDSIVEPQAEDEELPQVDGLRILKTNGPEWLYILLGALASVIMGASMPVYAILFGEVLGILAEPVETARAHSITYSILFLVVGCIVGLAMFLQIAMFTVAGEHLTLRMRKMAFEAMLRQEMGWFDHPSNNTGALCSRLSADAAAIQGATGSRFGAMVQSVFTILLAICAGIYHEWKLGLVSSLFVPFVLVGSVFQAKIMSSQDNVEREAFAKSAKLAVEAITNIRTVAGLCREKTFVERYIAELSGPHETAKKKAHVRGLVFGFAQAMPFFAYAGCMYYGGYLVSTEDLPYANVFKVAEALILGTMMVGQATAFAPNYNKAVLASARVFKLLDRRPLIDGDGQSGLRLDRVEGNIGFKNAEFCYPTRQQVNVLKSLNLSLTPGQKIALVGPSGCGKSTCVQLLQRFYNLHSGEMNVDGHNIESLNVPWVRSRMGIVSQEPVLFDSTLAENIRYGDNTRKATMDEVVDAAKQANIHSFIATLPMGYETRVGEKGTQLSGGQKQRVAIARALLRNPDLLLLDEATSALDTESEKLVQEALDKAQEGRTSITIAHRLSTVQHADKIFVISKGRVAESGTHSQLLSLSGIYAKLWSRQSGTSRQSKKHQE